MAMTEKTAMIRSSMSILALFLSLPVWADDSVLLTERNPDVLVSWAERYEHGEGVTRDIDRAVRLYCRAARAGQVKAQYQLGWLYANARGVARDDALAAAWFQLAAVQGDVYAQRMLRFFAIADEPVAQPPCILSDGTPVEAPRSVPEHYEQVVEWVQRLAPEFMLDPSLVLAVIQVESNFNRLALSPKNAQGLMQLIPATAERFGVSDVWDPQDNLRGGMAYLRWLLDHFEGNITLALAGYNAGEGAVQRYGGIPPYTETQRYVSKVVGLLGE